MHHGKLRPQNQILAAWGINILIYFFKMRILYGDAIRKKQFKFANPKLALRALGLKGKS